MMRVKATITLLTVLLAANLIFASGATVARAASEGWEGEYGFGEEGGKTAGGSVIFVYHQLRVYRENGVLLAEIESNGFQTSRQLVCEVKVVGQRAQLYFRRYGETNTFKPYKEGELLLTLERATRKGKRVVLTFWGAFQPAIKPLRSGKVYFTKEK